MSATSGASTASNVVETHVSWVLFAGDRAYKLLKPVTMPFFDHSKTSTRVAAVDEEIEMNRRIAPDVYLGSADVFEHGELVDRMIVMRRLPSDRRLSRLVGEPDFDDCLRAVARAVASFHSTQDPIRDAPMATCAAVRRNWADNCATIEPHVGQVIDVGEYSRVKWLAESYLDGRDALFQSRIDSGHVRDGHGDLIADDIFCLDDGPRIIDCLAFNDEWRIGDVLADVGFLVMDVQRLAGAPAASLLMRAYQELSYEHHPLSLAHHYVAYRAHVRVKVACLRHAQGDRPSAELAAVYHRLALDHLEQARLRMVLVGGGPGAGKTTVAAAIADHYGYVALATDEIRKDLSGVPRDEHRISAPGTGIYDDATKDASYEEQLREAKLLVERGHGVVLDASWTSERHRAAARRAAAEAGAELVELECVIDPALAKERIARRLSNVWTPSDATPDVVDFLAAARDPWPEVFAIATDQAPEAAIRSAVAHIDSIGPRPPAG